MIVRSKICQLYQYVAQEENQNGNDSTVSSIFDQETCRKSEILFAVHK